MLRAGIEKNDPARQPRRYTFAHRLLISVVPSASATAYSQLKSLTIIERKIKGSAIWDHRSQVLPGTPTKNGTREIASAAPRYGVRRAIHGVCGTRAKHCSFRRALDDIRMTLMAITGISKQTRTTLATAKMGLGCRRVLSNNVKENMKRSSRQIIVQNREICRSCFSVCGVSPADVM